MATDNLFFTPSVPDPKKNSEDKNAHAANDSPINSADSAAPVHSEANSSWSIAHDLSDDPKKSSGQSASAGTLHNNREKSASVCVPTDLTDAMRKEMAESQSRGASVKSVVTDNPKERVIVRFQAPQQNIYHDLEIPLDITANDLVIGIIQAYHLEPDPVDIQQCYLSCENPIALLKGKKQLGEIGLRDGSTITYCR